MKEILPCFFCGHGGKDDAIPTKIEDREYGEPDVFAVRCEWCAARGPEESTKAEALESWNRRVGK